MSTPSGEAPGAPGGGPRRRRRRRRHGSGGAPGREGEGRPATLVPQVSPLAEDVKPATDALAPDEVAEMRRHLAFLRSYREALRLKLNAAEDLLVNGQRDPTDRGVVRHLLAKVDRGAIDAAISREPLKSDAAARARMLSGAVRLIADVGVLLAYLEALAQVRSRAEAAQAFAEVVQRIDFEALSPSRLARLLHVLVETFVDHERVQVLFSLLALPPFRRAFDAAAASFPPEVADVFAPLRAVHRRALEEGGPAAAPAVLARGIELLLSAPDPVLRGYVEPLRIAVLELALGADVPAALADRAAGVLLSSLPRQGRLYLRLALRRAAQLLQRHVDDRARATLEELRRAQPDFATAQRWLAALDARRIGRIALVGDGASRGRFAAGFWLDGQRAVWIRTAAATDAGRVATEARLQSGLAIPGVAPVVEHGVASGIPYVAVTAGAQPFVLPPRLDLPRALSLAGEAARVLHAVALAGVALPDAEPARFLHGPSAAATAGEGLVLADLDGARATDPATALAAHRTLAVALARRLVGADMPRLPLDVADALGDAGRESLAELVGVLDCWSLRVVRD